MFLSAFYNLEHLVKEPTRGTNISSSLIDLILTNQPNNISNGGVIDMAISDHSLIHTVRKISMPKLKHNHLKVQNFKGFKNETLFRIYLEFPGT